MASGTESDEASDTPEIYKDPDDGRQRFLLELEFIQCLANPTYIHYLAQNRYFEDEAFIGYLKYLQYWQRPEYTKFIMYPHCLFFLEQLQNANFRNAMAHPANKELAHRQQFYFWKNYRHNRLKHILPRPLPEPEAAPPPLLRLSNLCLLFHLCQLQPFLLQQLLLPFPLCSMLMPLDLLLQRMMQGIVRLIEERERKKANLT